MPLGSDANERQAKAFGTAVFGLLIDKGFTIENIAFVGASYVVISLALLILIRKTIEPIRLPN